MNELTSELNSFELTRPQHWQYGHCEKKRFAQKFTDGRRTDRQTDDGRLAIVLAHSWNELKIIKSYRKSKTGTVSVAQSVQCESKNPPQKFSDIFSQT